MVFGILTYLHNPPNFLLLPSDFAQFKQIGLARVLEALRSNTWDCVTAKAAVSVDLNPLDDDKEEREQRSGAMLRYYVCIDDNYWTKLADFAMLLSSRFQLSALKEESKKRRQVADSETNVQTNKKSRQQQLQVVNWYAIIPRWFWWLEVNICGYEKFLRCNLAPAPLENLISSTFLSWTYKACLTKESHTK